jgi:hypothetical protein
MDTRITSLSSVDVSVAALTRNCLTHRRYHAVVNDIYCNIVGESVIAVLPRSSSTIVEETKTASSSPIVSGGNTSVTLTGSSWTRLSSTSCDYESVAAVLQYRLPTGIRTFIRPSHDYVI